MVGGGLLVVPLPPLLLPAAALDPDGTELGPVVPDVAELLFDMLDC